MNAFNSLCCGLVPLLILLAGCAESKLPSGVELMVRYTPLQPGFENEREPGRLLSISKAGPMVSAGVQLSESHLEAILEEWHTDEVGTVGVRIDADASFGNVMRSLGPIAQDHDYLLMGLKRHEVFASPMGDRSPEGMAGQFRGEIDKFKLAVSVGPHDEAGQCSVAVEGAQSDSVGLADRAFTKLDRLVQEAGGVGAFETGESFDVLVARIQAKPETPWRCVAGTIYNVQTAGWPFIQLELLAD